MALLFVVAFFHPFLGFDFTKQVRLYLTEIFNHRGVFHLFWNQCLFQGGREVTSVKKKETKKSVIAHRKACKAKGTGLSHYILVDKKGK